MAKLDNKTNAMAEAVLSGNNLETALDSFANEIVERATLEAQQSNNGGMTMNTHFSKDVTLLASDIKLAVTDGTVKTVDFPVQVIDELITVVQAKSKLIQAIDTTVVSSATAKVMFDLGVEKASWSALCDPITGKNAFIKYIPVNLAKLSGFIALCNADLELSDVKLGAYVMDKLAESIQMGLEDGVINGTGKDQPIGLIKNTNEVNSDGTQKDIIATENPINIETVANAIAKMQSVTIDGETKERIVNMEDLHILVNSAEALTRVEDFYTMNSAGVWVSKLPFNLDVIASPFVKKGTYIIFQGRDYKLVTAGQEFAKSSENRFVEDETVFRGKLYANGRPYDSNVITVGSFPKAEA